MKICILTKSFLIPPYFLTVILNIDISKCMPRRISWLLGNYMFVPSRENPCHRHMAWIEENATPKRASVKATTIESVAGI